jgi:hypothetical protein
MYSASKAAVMVGPVIHCLPRYRILRNSREMGSKCLSICLSIAWQAAGLADIARHVKGCHLLKKPEV